MTRNVFEPIIAKVLQRGIRIILNLAQGIAGAIKCE